MPKVKPNAPVPVPAPVVPSPGPASPPGLEGVDDGSPVNAAARAGGHPAGLGAEVLAKGAAFEALEGLAIKGLASSPAAEILAGRAGGAIGQAPGKPSAPVERDGWDSDAALATRAPAKVPGHAPVGPQAPDGGPDGGAGGSGGRAAPGLAWHADKDAAPTLPVEPQELADVKLFESAANSTAPALLTSSQAPAAAKTGTDPTASTESGALAAARTAGTLDSASSGVFDVRSYGATPGDATDDTRAIQGALDAARAAGGGTVYLPQGVYIVSGTGNPTDGALRIGSNVTLDGDGMGLSVLKLADGYASAVTGIIRTPINTPVSNIAITDLTIDGNKAKAPAHDVIGFFTGDVDTGQYTSDVLVQRVEIHDVSGYGFDPHEQTYRIRILDSVAHHNGKDGFALDYLVDSEVSGNVSYANARHGFNVVTQTHDLLMTGNEAYGNGSAGLVVQRGSFNVPGPYNITVEGGSFHDNGQQGVLVKMSDRVTVTGAEIHGNGRTGVELYGSDESRIIDNVIRDNSTSTPYKYDGVLVRTYRDSVFGGVFTSERNEISQNDILGAHRYGILEPNDGSGSNVIRGNTITGNLQQDILVSSPSTIVEHSEPPPDPSGVFDVASYGATANDATDDTAAINGAIMAAKAAGGGTVVMSAGTFVVSGNPADKSDGAVRLLSGVTLQGAGMGQTVIKVADGWRGDITGVVRTPFAEVTTDVGLYDLTIDGNRGRAGGTGKIDGFYTGVMPGSTQQDADITVDGVEVMNMSGYGFDPHEQTIRLTIEDSVAHHNGLDGFVADYIVDGVYRNNLAYANDRHGFNITTTTTNLLLQDNVARDNGSTGVTVQRGSEDIPWPSGIRISGGEYHGNVREGIYLKLADDVTVTGAHIHDNGYSGVRVDGATDTTIQGSSIHDNSKAGNLAWDEVRVEEFADPTTGRTFAGLNTQVLNNTFSFSDPALHAAYAIREMDDSSSGTVAQGNAISGWTGTGIYIPGTGGPGPIQGTEGADTLTGTAGDDGIQGLGGDDVLVGGAGGDSLDGGDGADTASYAGSATAVIVSLQAGTAGGGDAQGDSLASIENLAGSGFGDALTGDGNANALYGVNGNDTLEGLGGGDTLDGGGGADRMVGGAGDDLYIVNMGTDVVVEQAGEGMDTVAATNSTTLAANVENLHLLGTAAASATGNGLDNQILGNGTANVLKGLAGADTLDGGGGADTMDGGDGNDTFYVDDAGDVVTEKSNGGLGGSDTVYSSVDYVLPTQVERLVLTGSANLNGTGNTAANLIAGNAGVNQLAGGGGNDVFVMTRGLFGGDQITDFVGNGPAAGDSLRFEGFGAGATLTNSGDQWTVTDGGYTESFRLAGVTSLSAGSDYVFLG